MISLMLMSLAATSRKMCAAILLVRDVQQGHLRNFLSLSPDDFCFFIESAPSRIHVPSLEKAPTDVNGNVVRHAELGRARVEYLGSARGHFDRGFIGQRRPEPGIGHHVGVGREDTVHVGADLADRRIQRRSDRCARDIPAAPPERRHFVVFRNALEPGDDDDFTFASSSSMRAVSID